MKFTPRIWAGVFSVFLLPQGHAERTDLANLYELARLNDTLLSQVSIQRDIRHEAIHTARANLLPQINTYFALQALKDHRDVHSTYGGSGTAAEVGIRANQLLYSPAVRLGVKVAQQEALGSQLLFDKAEQALVLRTSQAYFNVLRSEARLAAAQAIQQAIEEQRTQTKRRIKLGMSSELDLHEATAQLDMANATIIHLKSFLQQRFDALRTLTGQTFTQVEPLNTHRFSPEIPRPNQVDWLTSAGLNNFDIQLANLAVSTAQLELKRARAGHLPTLALSAGVQQSLHADLDANLADASTTPVELDDRLTSADLAVSLDLPLYAGGRTSSLVKIARQGVELAQVVQDDTRRNVEEQVRFAEQQVSASLHALLAYEQSQRSAEAALVATEKGYEVGSRTMSELLLATGNVYSAQTEAANARFDFIEQALTLKFLAGDLTPNDITVLNAGLVRSQADE
ncbi:TolC family outer membrane protein [Ferrimonas pelagia]|uniref:Outer membrane channel protein TolC n=1 Tax=Ferrimonas pelagia TaxID=1177826 RepID=A0ABP9FDH3_9GAMM